MIAERALLAHHLRSLRRGALTWSGVFGLLVLSSAIGYRSTYPHAVDRLKVAATLGHNAGLQAIFGHAYALETVGGFTAWRAGGVLSLAGGIWGLLAGTRLLRGEEEAGRAELVLAGALRTSSATGAALAALAVAALAVFAGGAIGAAIGGAGHEGWSAASSLFLGLALSLPVAVFMAVGALCSQLASTRRLAAAMAGAAFAAAFLLRVAADSSSGAHWLRSLTPLGWVEQLRPLAHPEPLPLVPLFAVIALATMGALAVARSRDLGSSPVRTGDEREPRLRGLASTTAQAARTSWSTAAGWCAALGLAGFLFGLISKGVAKVAEESPAFARAASHVKGANILTAAGYIGITFLMVMAALSVLAATEVSAAREEEASGRLDALLVQPVGRRRWLSGRLAVGLVYVVAAAFTVALLAFAGASAAGARVGIGSLVQGALNTLPVAALYLGAGTLALGLLPRHAPALALGLVAGLFLLELVGSSIGAPRWLLWISPFDHVGFVPGGSIDVAPALVMAGLAAAATAAGIEAFARRDLVPA